MKEKKLTGYATIDRPWEQYYSRKYDESEIPNISIYQLALNENMNNMKNIAIDLRSSINNYRKGIKITYEELFKKINKSAKSSFVMGIKSNEIVPFILPNLPEARYLIYSNSIIGSISYPISPLMPVNQLEKLISDYEIKNLFIFKDFYEKYSSALKNKSLNNIVLLDGSESLPNSIQELKNLKKYLSGSWKKLFIQDKRIVPWYEYMSSGKLKKDNLTPFYEDNHITAIIGTSGTTGMSKGVCLTDKNVNTAGLGYKNSEAFPGNFMDALLPSIGYGISVLHFQTVAGKYVYLIPELLTATFPNVLTKLKPDNFPGGPVHYINLSHSNEFNNNMLPKFENLISGGASLPKNIEEKLNGVSEGYTESSENINNNILVRQGYALTENVAYATYSKRGSYAFGSIGIPLPYLTVGIFKPDTDDELKYNEAGEICITGPSVMQGYLNNVEETEKVIKVHKDGKRWIHTKDIGYMDESGRLFHVDRIKNIFMRTGFNVHPSKITEFINSIEFVKNSIVIGFEHPSEQCVPIAFIEIDEEKIKGRTEKQLEEELKKLCYDNLEETSVPYAYVFVNLLPINLGGKIDQQKIKNESQIDLTISPKVKKRVYFEQK